MNEASKAGSEPANGGQSKAGRDESSLKNGALRHPSRNYHGVKGHNESDRYEEPAPDQDRGPHTEEDDGDDVIKVARTPTSPALLSQLEHRYDYVRANALGAGHTGAATWKVQRMTALALIPLAIWFAVSVVRLSFASQAEAAAWLAYPANATVMAVFIVIALRHAVIGIESVFQDYVDGEGLRTALMLAVKLVALVLAVVSVAALIHLAV